METTRNQKQLESFTTYCKTHPEERFWQALRNWSETRAILMCPQNCSPIDFITEGAIDTFYLEGKNKEDLSELETNEI